MNTQRRNRLPHTRDGYREFPNLAHRNALQERLEVPALVRLLGLPRGGRVLEVGVAAESLCPHLTRSASQRA